MRQEKKNKSRQQSTEYSNIKKEELERGKNNGMEETPWMDSHSRIREERILSLKICLFSSLMSSCREFGRLFMSTSTLWMQRKTSKRNPSSFRRRYYHWIGIAPLVFLILQNLNSRIDAYRIFSTARRTARRANPHLLEYSTTNNRIPSLPLTGRPTTFLMTSIYTTESMDQRENLTNSIGKNQVIDRKRAQRIRAAKLVKATRKTARPALAKKTEAQASSFSKKKSSAVNRNSGPRRKPKSSKQLIFFNKHLSSMLRRERYSLECTQKVDGILWNLVEPFLKRPKVTAKDSIKIDIPAHPNGTFPSADKYQSLPFDAVTFNIVMMAWSRQSSQEGAEKAHEWLRRLWRMAPHLKADSYSYGAVINAMKNLRSVEGAIAAQSLLEQYVSTNKLDTDNLHNTVMDAWAGSGHAQAGDRALSLLRQLEAHPRIKPTYISYNTCIKAFANTPGQAERAQAILEQMKQSNFTKPNKVSYTTCIHGWSNVIKQSQQDTGEVRRKAIQEIRRLLQEIEDTYAATKDDRIRPDLYTYTAVLSSQAVSPLELWARMERFGDGKQAPNAAFLNTCIHLLGQALERKTGGLEPEPNGADGLPFDPSTTAEVAETLLRQMQHRESVTVYDDSNPSYRDKVCKVTYTSVMAVWAQCGTIKAALRAESLLDELQALWEATNDLDYLPSAKTFCNVLTAWNKAASLDAKTSYPKNESFSIVDNAISLLHRMNALHEKTQSPELAPSKIIFVQIFQLLAKTQDAMRAKEVLEIAKEGNVPVDSTVLSSFINALTKSGINNTELATHILDEVEHGYSRGTGHLKPNSLLYSSVLQAYAKSASRQGALLAEQLLERTTSMYRSGKLFAKPTVMFYNAVIDAHARSNGGLTAAERSEELLIKMEQKAAAGDKSLKPNTRSYNAVILAWRNSKAPDAPQRAENLLSRMEERLEKGEQDCRPDLVTYNSIVGVWAKSNLAEGPQRAKELLLFMENQTAAGEPAFQPDRITYNSCIDAFARRGAAEEATEIFDKMMQFHTLGHDGLEPDQITLTSLRNAWQARSDKEANIQMERIERIICELKQKQEASNTSRQIRL